MGNRKLICFFTFLTIILLLLPSFSLFSSAADTSDMKVFEMPMQQPLSGGAYGYLEYVVEDSNFVQTPVTLFWKVVFDPTYLPAELQGSYNSDFIRAKFELFEPDYTEFRLSFEYVQEDYFDSPLDRIPFQVYYGTVRSDGSVRYYTYTFNPQTDAIPGFYVDLASGYKFSSFKFYNVAETVYPVDYYPKAPTSFLYSESAPIYHEILETQEYLADLSLYLNTVKNNSSLTNTYLREQIDYLETLTLQLANILSIQHDLSLIRQEITLRLPIISSQLSSIDSYLYLINNNIVGLQDRLDDIIDILSQEAPEVPDPDPDDIQGSYEDAQNEVIQNENVDEGLGYLDEITDSLSGEEPFGDPEGFRLVWTFAWNYITYHPFIFSFFLLVPSLGLIRMVLHR